jgi:hypothetical protein
MFQALVINLYFLHSKSLHPKDSKALFAGSVSHDTNKHQPNKALHPTAYSSVRRSSSLRFRRRVSLSFCRRAQR